jgi:Domain of unknown function (DUF6883)
VKLPYQKNSIIKREKLTRYLLNLTHPVGGAKAKFFRGIGFNGRNIEKFEQELYRIGKNGDVKSQKSSEDSSGTNYMIIGALNAPDGNIYSIEVVWYIKTGTKNPSFITAYPV